MGCAGHLSGRLLRLVYQGALWGGSGAAAVGGVGLLWLEAELLLHVNLVLLPCFELWFCSCFCPCLCLLCAFYSCDDGGIDGFYLCTLGGPVIGDSPLMLY